jgi:TRAP-type mannitol/chloroaromatic compound transport system substrate-binding protein
MVINTDIWNGISTADQKLIETACTAGVLRNLARSEALQGEVIAGFPSIGVTAERLPIDVLKELQRVTERVLEEEAAKDEDFATILRSQRAYRANYAHWKALAYLPRDF